MAVANGIAVVDRDHGDRRQRGAALLGLPHPQPAAARRGAGPELAIEVRGAVRLDGTGDRIEWDLPYDPARAGAQRVDGEPHAIGAPPPEPVRERRATAGPHGLAERALALGKLPAAGGGERHEREARIAPRVALCGQPATLWRGSAAPRYGLPHPARVATPRGPASRAPARPRAGRSRRSRADRGPGASRRRARGGCRSGRPSAAAPPPHRP